MQSEIKPIVLVVSEATKTSPISIINNIRKCDDKNDVYNVYNNSGMTLQGYGHNIKNKYYETDILFVPYEDDLQLLPPDLVSQIEGIFIYFDPKIKSFCTKIPTYMEFVESNNIDLGVLLCDLLYDDDSEGLTFKEIRNSCILLDIIELSRINEENEDSHLNPCGYDELHQVLRNVIWSNISMASTSKTSSAAGTGINSVSLKASTANTSNIDNQPDDSAIERELEKFEKLITEVMMFKETTKDLCEDARWVYAERMAIKFDKLLEDDNNLSDAKK